MKTLSLKIAVSVVLVLAVAILVKVFWPAEIKQPVAHKDTAQAQKQAEIDFAHPRQLKTKQTESKQSTESARLNQSAPAQAKYVNADTKEKYARAEQLYQAALRQKNAAYSSVRRYKITVQSCRYIIERYPLSPQAEKARELLQQVPQRYRQRYARSTTFFPVQGEPKVKKSKPLRSKLPRRYLELYDIDFVETRPLN